MNGRGACVCCIYGRPFFSFVMFLCWIWAVHEGGMDSLSRAFSWVFLVLIVVLWEVRWMTVVFPGKE